uniref:Uncharacterized protein n=1 Tax=Anguilla anguilla TaxID=7936 RepID=A0A0E9RG85_ANGAN
MYNTVRQEKGWETFLSHGQTLHVF